MAQVAVLAPRHPHHANSTRQEVRDKLLAKLGHRGDWESQGFGDKPHYVGRMRIGELVGDTRRLLRL